MSLDVAAKASHVAVLGWGAGLAFVGLGLILAGILILFNFRNLSGRYFESIVSAGSPLPFLGRRYRVMQFDHAKSSIAAALLFGGAIFTSLGIYIFTAL